eukprot:7763897-Lingulodinium_polyedra.AAC.1
MLRLVLDCRSTNELHTRPPKSQLATPAALSNLLCGEAWAEAAARAAGGGGPSGDLVSPVELSGGSIDLLDGFY